MRRWTRFAKPFSDKSDRTHFLKTEQNISRKKKFCIIQNTDLMMMQSWIRRPRQSLVLQKRDKYGRNASRTVLREALTSLYLTCLPPFPSAPRYSSTAPTIWGLSLLTSCPASSEDMAASILQCNCGRARRVWNKLSREKGDWFYQSVAQENRFEYIANLCLFVCLFVCFN